MSPPPAGAQITREGILRTTIGENLARHESKVTYSLHSGGKATPVLPTSPVTATTGDRVVVKGAMLEGKLVGSVTGVESAVVGGGPIFAGPRKVAVLLVKFAGDPAEPWSPAVTREKIFTGAASADAFFREESRGVISLAGKANPDEGDVFGWFTLDTPGFGCSHHAWGNEALDQATGIPLGGYNHIVYAFTHRSGCFWSGMATGAGNTGTIFLNGNVSVRTIAHEFGHNFGLDHAGSMTCVRGGVRVQISSSCGVDPYGDVFDAMGSAARHNNGWNLAKLGMLGATNVVTVTDDGTYTLRAALSLDPAPTILRIPRTRNQAGDVISWYYLEVRQQGGIFENVADKSMTGVSIRATEGVSSINAPETLLIDSTPSTFTFTDAPLQVGKTFYDGSVRIETLAAGGGTASVSIELNAVDSEAPSAPANVSASQNAAGVKLQWSASTDNLGVARYIVFRDGSEVGASPTASFTDSSATVGEHTYTVYAEDEAGNRSPGSAPKVVTVLDLAAPEAPPDEPSQPQPPDEPQPTDGAPRTKPAEQALRAKPALRWHRRPDGGFAFEVDASGNPGVARVSLWLDGKLLRSRRGRILRLVWRPRVTRCARVYRFSARAHEPSADGRFTETTRVRQIRLPRAGGGCRGRGSAARAWRAQQPRPVSP